MRLSDFLSSIGRPVAFYPGLVKALGDRNEAIFICQMAYWRGKGENAEGWIYKTSDEIEEETSLTYKEQINVRNGLTKKSLLEEYYARTEHKMYYRVIWDKVNEIWEQFTIGHMPDGKTPLSNGASGSLPEVSSLNSNTETPPQTTTDPFIIKQRLDFFVSQFGGKFNSADEMDRFICLWDSAGETKVKEIIAWALKKEIHLENRSSLLDSMETAAENWKGKQERIPAGAGASSKGLDGQSAADLLRS